MNTLQPSFSLPVDATNPGQFFACCGLLELAHRLWPEAEGRFHPGRFEVAVPQAEANALKLILARLSKADIEPDTARGDKATQPIRLKDLNLTLDWWIHPSGGKTRLKLWAGQQTSLRIVNDLCQALAQVETSSTDHLFDAGLPLTGRFGVDPRAAWNALDVGFSPNEQQMEVATFPAVELLAAVGLQGFRPREDDAYPNIRYYATWSAPLPAAIARAAAAGLIPAGEVRQYRFQIVGRGSYKGFDYSVPIGDYT
jgi:CRISPR-associated protein Csx14